MALKVELKPNERIIIGACVITNTDQRARLLIDGDKIPILREKDILTPDTADTPAKLIYLAVQLMYLSPDPMAHHPTYFSLVRDILSAMPSAWPFIEGINNHILNGDVYHALKEAKKLIGHEELIADPRYKSQGSRMRIVDEVDGFVSAWTRTLGREAIVELLIAAGIPCAPVRTIEELIADQDVAARAMLIDSEFPTRGPIKVLGSPLKLSDAPRDPGALARPPALGEHNAEVLATVGHDAAALDQLRRDGVI